MSSPRCRPRSSWLQFNRVLNQVGDSRPESALGNFRFLKGVISLDFFSLSVSVCVLKESSCQTVDLTITFFNLPFSLFRVFFWVGNERSLGTSSFWLFQEHLHEKPKIETRSWIDVNESLFSHEVERWSKSLPAASTSNYVKPLKRKLNRTLYSRSSCPRFPPSPTSSWNMQRPRYSSQCATDLWFIATTTGNNENLVWR